VNCRELQYGLRREGERQLVIRMYLHGKIFEKLPKEMSEERDPNF
jgi:hypothetical protein